MATHSSVLAWRIPGMGEPGGLPSMGSQSRTRLKRLSISNIPSYAILLVAVGNGTVSLVSLSDFSCCAIGMQTISVY